MIGPYNESNKYRLEQEIASLRAQVAELKGGTYDFGACVLQVREIDRLRAEIANLHSELASARTVERKGLHEQIERLLDAVGNITDPLHILDADDMRRIARDALRAALSAQPRGEPRYGIIPKAPLAPKCGECKGTGHFGPEACPSCGGHGR